MHSFPKLLINSITLPGDLKQLELMRRAGKEKASKTVEM